MTKRLLGRVAVRLYPTEIRDSRGEEILGTLLDAGAASAAAFVRQLASLVAGGLVARSRRALAQPPAKIAVSAVCWTAIVVVTQFPFRQGMRVLDGVIPSVPLVTVRDTYVLPLVILASFTLGGRRLAGLLGLAWVAVYARESELPELAASQLIGMVVLPAAGFGLLTLRPQAVPRAWEARILWLVPALALALVNLVPLWFSNPLLWFSEQSVVILIPVVAALVLLPVAPAFAIGTALAWSARWGLAFGDQSIWTIALLACTPVTLALVAAGRFAIGSYD